MDISVLSFVFIVVVICLIVFPQGAKGNKHARDYRYEDDRRRNDRRPGWGLLSFLLIGGLVTLGGFLISVLLWTDIRQSSPQVTQQVTQIAQEAPRQPATPSVLPVDAPLKAEKIPEDSIAEESESAEEEAGTSDIADHAHAHHSPAPAASAHAETAQEASRSAHSGNVRLSSFGIITLVLLIAAVIWIIQHPQAWKIFALVGGVCLVMMMTALFSYRSMEREAVKHLSFQETQRARALAEQERMKVENEVFKDSASSPSETEGPALLNPEIGAGRIVESEEHVAGSSVEPATSAGTSTSSIAAPAIVLHSDITVWAIIGSILIVFLIGGGIWIAHYKQHWTIENFRYSASQFLWVLPMLGVVGWVGSLYAPYFSLHPLKRDVEYSAAETDFYRYRDDTEVETEGQFQVAAQGISPWVTNGKTNHQDKVLVPVHGGWRESQSEAENYADRQALRVLKKDFESTFPEAQSWRIEMALRKLNAIQRMETESRQFTLAGKDVEMYRTHLQVELSNRIRGEIMKAWTPRLRTFRTTILQVCMVLLMIVFFAIGGTLSIDMRTHGAYSRWIRFASLIIVFAAGVGAFMMRDALLFRYLI
ncbi:MAG: hypothetical protein HUJ26_08635 [Planctomycetaceae bacterium]|nr:hypothetical protein [Planctomycetaceae bacterium]